MGFGSKIPSMFHFWGKLTQGYCQQNLPKIFKMSFICS